MPTRKQRILWGGFSLLFLSLEMGSTDGYIPNAPRSILKPTNRLRVAPSVASTNRRNENGMRLPESISSSPEGNSMSSASSIGKKISVLWRFTRPHTIIGSALAIPALHLLAAPSYSTAITARSIYSMIYAMVPSLLMNLYITGLNQITDIEIDKINKPNLPIASGDLSKRDAIGIVFVSLIVSMALGVANPAFATEGLVMALGMSAILGTLYSLPPFRLKRFPLLAAFCIVAVRGYVINAGFFAHATVAAYASSGGAGSVLQCLSSNPKCALSSLYFAVFGLVIALMKDVPDIKGDALSNIRTVSVRLGAKTVFAMIHRLLTGLFWGAGAAFFKAALCSPATNAVRLGRAFVGVSAFWAGFSVQKEAVPVDPENPKQVYGYYMHLWKLFYLSYFALPFAR